MCIIAAKTPKLRHRPSSAGKLTAFCPGCRTRLNNWICCCFKWPRRARCGPTGFTSRASVTSRQHWQRTLGKRSLCDCVFHEDKFLCRAVCAELAGKTVPLREILRARNRRRRELRGVLRDRESAVNTLLYLKRGGITEKEHAQQESGSAEESAKPPSAVPRLKRYKNE